jgi:hypothetical protein
MLTGVWLVSLKGLFVGMEDELTRPVNEFFHERFERRPLALSTGPADALQLGWHLRFRPGSPVEIRDGRHARAGDAATKSDVTNRLQLDLQEFRLGGHLQTNNGMNYAVRF